MTLIAKDPQVDIDNQPLRFGKWKGQTPNQIAEHDPGYITWLWDNLDDPPCTKSLALAYEEADQIDVLPGLKGGDSLYRRCTSAAENV